MATFQESAAKATIRGMLRGACEDLQRSKLTYLGLPGSSAMDVRRLGPLLENVICIDKDDRELAEARRHLATLQLKKRQFMKIGMWEYLRDKYASEPLLADITFLDFCGGGLHKDDPFATEIAGIRAYFAKHARHANKAFVFAWTYMPRDGGALKYRSALGKVVSNSELLQALGRTKGVWLRSAAVRLLLWQSMHEHGAQCAVYHHAVYKKSMNTIILVLSKGTDPDCRIALESPDCLISEPAYVYSEKCVVPRVIPVFDI